MEAITNTAVAINCIRRWPAVKLAVNRTPNANGRIKRLMVSIIIRAGMRAVGVACGSKCPSALVGLFRIPMITVASQRGTARPRFMAS